MQEIMTRLDKSQTAFAKQTKKILDKMSPMSLCAVFEQHRRGQSMTIKEVFEMESKMAWAFYTGTDFYEGLRAFVERDFAPKWSFKSVYEVK